MRTRRLITGLAVLVLLSVSLIAPVTAQDGDQPFIGIRFVQENNGALIAEVVLGSPADEAGLLTNDLITAIDGTTITLDTPLIAVVENYAPGDTVQLTVDRSGETLELSLTFGTRPEDDTPAPLPPAVEGELRRHISVAGATFIDLGEYWHVSHIAPDTPAAEAGLLPGDMVASVDGHPISAYDSGVLATLATQGGDVLLAIQRGGDDLELTLTLPPGTSVTSTIEESIVIPPTLPETMPDMPEATPAMPPEIDEPEAKGYLGVAFVPLNQDVLDSLAEEAELPFEMPVASEGALIIGVQEDSPADEAGIVMGDVIVEVDGDRVDEERTLADRIYAYEEGDTIVITMLRGADVLEFEVTLIARPPELGAPGTLIVPQPPSLTPFSPFAAPDFDLDQFLDENPEFLDELEALGLPGLLGPMFADPDFDWPGFLMAHPGFMDLLERLAETYTPEELEELFPEFPWFGEFDPFHGDMDPRMPGDKDNAPA